MTITTAPALTVTADADTPVVTVTVAAGNWASGGPMVAQVERSADSGDTWQVIRGLWELVADVAWAVDVEDWEAPALTALSYRARAVEVAAPSNIGPWSTTIELEPVDFTGFWLVDVRVPSLRTRLHVRREPIPMNRERDQGRFKVLARPRDVVLNGIRRGHLIALPVRCSGSSSFDALDAVIDGGRTCLLRFDTDGRMFYVQPGPTTSATLLATGDMAVNPIRDLVLDLVEVDVPLVGA